MDKRRSHDRSRLLTLSLLVVPLALAGCGASGTTASGGSGGSGAGPTPTSGVAAAIGRISTAYGNMASVVHAGNLPAWIAVGADGKSVALTITTTGVTFNGASQGKMTITVPQGWRVTITDRNATRVAHSLVIAAQAGTPLPATGFARAITGASTANASVGQAHATQRFSFVARPAGHYLMVSDVSGQAAAGLWAHFDVSASARVPAVTMG